MSILGSLIDSIGVNSPRKAPSTRDRLANDLVAAEGLQVKREKANDYIIAFIDPFYPSSLCSDEC